MQPNCSSIADVRQHRGARACDWLIRDGNQHWCWIKRKRGLVDVQPRPYVFNGAPLLADLNAVVQGYTTNDCLMPGKPLGAAPKICRLSGERRNNSIDAVQTNSAFLQRNPDVVARFARASAAGWKHCADQDYSAAKVAILNVDPCMRVDMVEYSGEVMIDRRMIQGDQGLPVGAASDANWANSYECMIAAGALKPGLDVKAGYVSVMK